jgi:flagellar biosynthesis protein FlhA
MRGVPITVGEAYADALWVTDDGTQGEAIYGIEGCDPVTGRQGWWVEASFRDEARAKGFRIEEPASRIIRHLAQVVRTHSDELLTRQHVHELLSHLKQQSPRLVEDVVPERATPATIHRILCGLLRERVAIRDLETIIEALGETSATHPAELIERTRFALRRTICQQYRDEQRTLCGVVLDVELELMLADQQVELNGRLRLPGDVLRQIAEALLQLIHSGRPPVVVVAAELRADLRRALAPGLPQVAVDERHGIADCRHDRADVEAPGRLKIETSGTAVTLALEK